MHHVGDIEASSSDSCCHQNWHPTSLEVFKSLQNKQLSQWIRNGPSQYHEKMAKPMQSDNEAIQYLLSFTLKPVTVDTSCWKALNDP